MKKNKTHVLLHKPTGLFYKSRSFIGYGPNNFSVYQIQYISDVAQADLASIYKLENILKVMDRHHCLDAQKNKIFSSEFEIKEVLITYKLI